MTSSAEFGAHPPSGDPAASDDAMAAASAALMDAIPGGVDHWFRQVLLARGLPPAALDAAEIQDRIAEARESVVDALGWVLAQDIDDQRANPLHVLRRVVPVATEILVQAGVPAVDRDDDAVRIHPDDRYDLTPAAFADFGPAVAGAGLEWGAAKAYVHLRRRRRTDR